MGIPHYRTIKRTKISTRLLRAVAACPCVVISAPMGYGKTHLAREFSAVNKTPSYYFAVPAGSDDVDAFWHMLWTEMDAQGMAGAAAIRDDGFPTSSAQNREIIGLLADLPAAAIIIDDYHNARIPALDAFLENAFWSGIGDCRVLLFSRTRPEINLDELQFKGLAALFDQDMLAFTEFEAKQLFFANGVNDMNIAGSAWKYSEGWAAALWLCLQNSRQRGELPPSGDVEQLLETVVFNPYSDADKLFLMQLSLLDFFSVAEAAAITGDDSAGRRLARLHNRNTFISRDQVRPHYQFHSIFKDFLQKKLLRRTGVKLPILYRKTAECHFARGEFLAAFRLLAKAGREKDQLRLLELLREQSGEGVWNCHRTEVEAAIEKIPWRLRRRQPYGIISYLWLFICHGDEENFMRFIEDTEERFRNDETIPDALRNRLLGELEFIRAGLVGNDMTAMRNHYANACALLNGPSFLRYDRLSWSWSSPHLSFVFLRDSGDYHRLLGQIADNQKYLTALTNGNCAGGHDVARAEYHLERGELDEAERLLAELKTFFNLAPNHTLFILIRFCEARLLCAKGAPEEGLRLIMQGKSKIEETGSLEHIAGQILGQAYILASQGRTDQLPGWLFDKRVYGEPYNSKYIQSFIMVLHGKALLAKNDYDGLRFMLESMGEDLGQLRILFARIHRKIFEAFLAKHADGADEAMKPMIAALELSRPDGIILPFVEYGDRILPLLRGIRRSMPQDKHLRRILECCNRTAQLPKKNRNYKKSLLTPREREIMRMVTNGKTTPSIAQSLGVSESTIKKTLTNIYSKLSAKNRVEAMMKFNAMYGPKLSGNPAPYSEEVDYSHAR